MKSHSQSHRTRTTGWSQALGGQPLAVVLAAGLMSFAHVPSAWAHAALLKSEPARRAALAKSPSQVRLWFNERLEPAYVAVDVLRQDGVSVVHQPARVDKGNPELVVLDLPPLDPGAYTVKYRVLSVDGHTVNYGYTFSIKNGSGSR